MIDVQNRTPLPGKAGRVTLALDDGTTLGGTLSMADEATQEGTPWDRDTARKLQADIRAYPVAAGQSITAGDAVDVVGGAVTKAGTPSQAIALTTAAAGADCEIIYSGVAALSGVTVGQKITSDGVYGVGVLDGVLQVWSKDRPVGVTIVTGTFVSSSDYAHPVSIELGFKPDLVICYSGSNNDNAVAVNGSNSTNKSIPRIITKAYTDGNTMLTASGFNFSSSIAIAIYYVAIKEGA